MKKPTPSCYICTFDPVLAILDFTKSRFQFFKPPWVHMQQRIKFPHNGEMCGRVIDYLANVLLVFREPTLSPRSTDQTSLNLGRRQDNHQS